tara:strand:- start:164 stop:1195 length:1032 start_codon:yes stop_codon:yes gene_type:complete
MLKNIIYLSHAEKNPSGGAKIIYHHSEIINNFKNFSSQVLHIKKKKSSKWKTSLEKKFKLNASKETGWQINQIEVVKRFKYKWFDHNIKTKNSLLFDRSKDFVILPEIFAHLASELLIKKKIKYAVFVQNGYAIASTNNEQKLKKAYLNASFILSYSDDITNCIKLKFPNIKTKIVKISYAIQINKSKIQKKQNLITFMSRKLPQHSNLVVNYLRNYLPKKWSVKDLNNLSEKTTYEYLRKSKIFLAFSNLEGLPLPPVEAALAKNYVVGYTGEGGNEYWIEPIFTRIYSGDINKFVKRIVEKIDELNVENNFPKKKYFNLVKKFSKENEIKNINNFLRYIPR